MTADRRALGWGLATLALTILHHVQGAIRYDTPARLHAAYFAAAAAALMAGAWLVHRRAPNRRLGSAALGLSRALNAGIAVLLFGLFEGVYNHVLKVALYLLGMPEGAMRTLYRSALYEMPNDLFFEATGVLQAVPAWFAAASLLQAVRGGGSLLGRSTDVALGVVRVTGPAQVVLGVLFWMGFARGAVPVHMAVGLAFVLAIWTLAGLGAGAGVGAARAVAVAALGAFVLGFGIVHPRILTGSLHWVVQVVHLLVGIAAMVAAGRLAGAIRARIGVAPAAEAESVPVLARPRCAS